MTTISARRICPFCRTELVLGALPIVATNVRVDSTASGTEHNPEQMHSPISGATIKGYVGIWPIIADPPLPSRSDEFWRWLSRQVTQAELPGVAAAADVTDLPARVCLHCETPLPEDIDERNTFTIAVVGTTGAGKSHYLASMLQQAANRQQLRGVGCREFVLDERTSHSYTQKYLVPVFRERVQLDHTLRDPEVARKPMVCRVTFDGAQPALLFFHDIAGEVLVSREARAVDTPFLRQADAVIFLVDPVHLDRPDGHTWSSNGIHDSGYANQADLLNALLREMRSANRSVPVAITLSKSDLLETFLPVRHPREFRCEPDLSSREAWDESLGRVDIETREMLRRCGAFDVLSAADALDPELASFHAVAALGCRPDPETGQVPMLRPTRCLDPLVTVLHRMSGLTRAI